MKRVGFIIIFIFFFSLSANAQSFYVELTQMFGLELGIDVPLSSVTGIRGGLGASMFSIKTINYSCCFYYKLPSDFENFDFYVDIGLPIAYLDLWEEKYVDWDSVIDSPYAGWLTGVTIRTAIFKHFILNTGVAFWTEWQEYHGTKYGVMPIISLMYSF